MNQPKKIGLFQNKTKRKGLTSKSILENCTVPIHATKQNQSSSKKKILFESVYSIKERKTHNFLHLRKDPKYLLDRKNMTSIRHRCSSTLDTCLKINNLTNIREKKRENIKRTVRVQEEKIEKNDIEIDHGYLESKMISKSLKFRKISSKAENTRKNTEKMNEKIILKIKPFLCPFSMIMN